MVQRGSALDRCVFTRAEADTNSGYPLSSLHGETPADEYGLFGAIPQPDTKRLGAYRRIEKSQTNLARELKLNLRSFSAQGRIWHGIFSTWDEYIPLRTYLASLIDRVRVR
jgi:hypothetical protein